MKELVIFACLIQLSGSCSCYDPPNLALFCDNPSWNVVKIRVENVIKDLPDEWWEEFDWSSLDPNELGEWPLPPLPRGPNSLNSNKETWENAEKEVEAVVEKVWGLGNTKVGRKMTLRSHNKDNFCGVAKQLGLGEIADIWIKENTTSLSVVGCHFNRFKHESPSREEYLDTLQTVPC